MPIRLLLPALPYSNGSLHLGHFCSTFIMPSVIYECEILFKRGIPLLVSGGDNYGTKNYFQIQGPDRLLQIRRISREHSRLLGSLGVFFNYWGDTSSRYHTEYLENLISGMSLKARRTHTSFCKDCNRYLGESYLEKEPEQLKPCGFCGSSRALTWVPTEDYFIDDFSNLPYPSVVSKVPIMRKIRSEESEFIGPQQLTWNLDFGVPFKREPNRVIAVWWEAIANWLSSSRQLLGGSLLSSLRDPSSEVLVFCGADILWHLTHKLRLIFHTAGVPLETVSINPRFLVTDTSGKLSKSKGGFESLGELRGTYGVDYIRFFCVYNSPEKKNFSFSKEIFRTQYHSIYQRQLILPLELYTRRFYEIQANNSQEIQVDISLEKEVYRLLLSHEVKSALKTILKGVTQLKPLLLRPNLKHTEYSILATRMRLLITFLSPICISLCSDLLSRHTGPLNLDLISFK